MHDAPGIRKKQTVPAKLTRPSSKGALRRERLFESIERGMEKKVLWISGPAGSGKTTLASSFFDSYKSPCLWYQLDEGDKDPATFFYYIGQAAKHAAPRNRKPLLLLTPEYLQGINVFSKRFFEQLGERLMGNSRFSPSKGNGGPAIVFDNYQDVPDDSMFQEVINAGLSSIPEGLSVIILSRSGPPPAYGRLRAGSEMSFLGWEDMQLTADECNTIARLKAGRDLAGETLSRLHQTTQGWVAGLVLFMESLGIEDFDLERPRALPREEIFGYFATELFDRKHKEDQAFLLETSFLPMMNGPMAEELTGNPRALRVFSNLSRNNYFISRYASSEPVFQYHPLLREFLLARAKETMAPERLADLRCRAAKVLEINGYSGDAVNLFCEAEEWREATRMILTHARGLISQGRWQTLLGWIECLPHSVAVSQPWLLYWMGVCRLATSPEGSMECFEQALEQFKSGSNATGSFLALSGMLDSVSFRTDTFLELDRLIAMMDDLLEQYPQFPSPEVEAHVVVSMLYALVLRQPYHPAYGHWEKCGLGLVREIPDMDLALRILCALVFYHSCTGELEKVELTLDSIKKKIDAGHATPFSVITQRDLQAWYYWLSGDFEKNRLAGEDGIARADSSGAHLLDYALLGHSAAGALSIGEIARAEGYLERMLSALRTAPTVNGECLHHVLKAWKYLIESRLVQASAHADLAIEFGAAMGSPLMEPYGHLIKAMVMHRLKDDEEASLHLTEFRKICGTVHLYQGEFMSSFVEAQIAFDCGDEASGRDHLRRAMALGRERGYVNGFFWESSMVAALCVKALEAGIEVEYVRHLIRKRNLMPDTPPLDCEQWPWALQIYTLGRFEIVRDGEAARFSGKVQKKPLEMLKALIAGGGNGISEDHLSDSLWPNADGDDAHNAFTTTLFRLRKLMGIEGAIKFQDGRVALDPHYCWVDARVFEKMFRQIERTIEENKTRLNGQESGVMGLAEKAISIYHGHFLPADDGHSWTTSYRERLRSRFFSMITRVGAWLEQTGQWEKAIEYYQKGLDIDDLAEELYQRLMICHQQLGQRSRAIDIYKRCKKMLSTSLGLEPLARTTEIYDGITGIVRRST